MFSEAVTKIVAGEKRRAALREVVTDMAQKGQFLLTEFLCEEKEPVRTDVQMVIDGHAMNGNSPTVDESLKIPLPPVRLMTIRETDTIKVKQVVTRRVMGTNILKQNREPVDQGNDVVLEHAIARDVLSARGFPVKDIRSNGAKKGTVVEVAWLLREVQKTDCYPEIKELFEKLQPRIEKSNTKKPTGKPV